MSLLHRRMMMEVNNGGGNMNYTQRRFVIEDASKPFDIPYEFHYNMIMLYKSKAPVGNQLFVDLSLRGKYGTFIVHTGTNNIIRFNGVYDEKANSTYYITTTQVQNKFDQIFPCFLCQPHASNMGDVIRFRQDGIAVGDEIIILEW